MSTCRYRWVRALKSGSWELWHTLQKQWSAQTSSHANKIFSSYILGSLGISPDCNQALQLQKLPYLSATVSTRGRHFKRQPSLLSSSSVIYWMYVERVWLGFSQQEQYPRSIFSKATPSKFAESVSPEHLVSRWVWQHYLFPQYSKRKGTSRSAVF